MPVHSIYDTEKQIEPMNNNCTADAPVFDALQCMAKSKVGISLKIVFLLKF